MIIPTHLTVNDLKSYYDEGYQLVQLTDTPTFRPEWGVWEAVRDLVQNSLDETDSFGMITGNDILTISDSGRGFDVNAFLKGQPQPKSACMRGKFGEGMKIATLALVRNGHPVSFTTAGRGRPLEGGATILDTTIVGTQVSVLSYLVRPGKLTQGTIWTIHNYTQGDVFKDRFTQTYPAKAIFRVYASFPRDCDPRRVDAIYPNLNGGTDARIFARDIYLRNDTAIWSYNLWDFDTAPDRHGPASESQLQAALGYVLFNLTEPGMGETLLKALQQAKQNNTEILERNARWPSLSSETEIKERTDFWTTAWRSAFGDKAGLLTSADLKPLMNHYNLAQIAMPDRFTYAFNGPYRSGGYSEGIVPTDLMVLRRVHGDLIKVREATINDLTQRQAITLQEIRYINIALSLALHAPEPRVLPGYMQALGLMAPDPTLSKIYINTSKLDTLRNALSVYIHEYAHYAGGSMATDNSDLHGHLMADTGSVISLLFANGNLKYVNNEVRPG